MVEKLAGNLNGNENVITVHFRNVNGRKKKKHNWQAVKWLLLTGHMRGIIIIIILDLGILKSDSNIQLG